MRILPGLLAAIALCAHADDAATRSGVGINLNPPKYWSSDWPFIDEFKRAGGWFTECAAAMPQCKDFAKGASARNTKEQDRLELDEHGWVKRLPAADDATVKFRSVGTLLFQGNGGAHPAGRYVVLYDGRGVIEYAGAGKKIASASRPGRDVLQVSNTPAKGLTIRIRRTAEGDHLRNIRVIGPGGVCADAPRVHVPEQSACRPGTYKSLEQLHTMQTFHPVFLADLQGFRTLRFMPWSGTNTTTMVSWNERPRLTDAKWASDNGVPLEAMLELSAALRADPWISVGARVDDDYIRRLAQLARQSIKPPNVLVFEYGNEPWNTAPPYNRAGEHYERKARERWPRASAEPRELQLNWYAYRSAEACRIVKREFAGDAGRVKCVVNAHPSYAPVAQTMLACELAKADLGRPCAREFDALAIAPYFGNYIRQAHHRQAVGRWTAEPDGGLALLFQEITGRDAQGRPATAPLYVRGGRTSRDGALARTREGMLANKKVADEHGLPLIAYEGGQHLTGFRGDKVDALFLAAQRDPRMGAALTRHYEDWKAVGGQFYVAYSYAGRYGRGNYWGMKEYQLDDAAPKWQALKAFRDAPCWWEGCSK
ncbi:hypothetical protein [Piscinibacter sp.]|uniref:hypothetical protein n=1 Tax=Piscinibacter sp. TaxID=1903157 RepID=UPI002D09578D|nr:hypothetical protein [Albitalea sp.]HUG22559.1 hypothetical protein [Albitalea sp.]